jgi:hypothetical protein
MCRAYTANQAEAAAAPMALATQRPNSDALNLVSMLLLNVVRASFWLRERYRPFSQVRPHPPYVYLLFDLASGDTHDMDGIADDVGRALFVLRSFRHQDTPFS